MLDTISMLAATDGGNVIQKLASQFHIEGPLLLAQAVNFMLVALALWFFAIRPLLATVEERNRKIREGLQYAEEMKERLADAERQSEQKLREAAEEAGKIVAQANESSKAFAAAQQQAAIAKAEQIVANAHKAMELEHKQLLEEVHGEVANLVVATTSKVLSKELDSNEKTRLSDAAAKELASA